MFCFPFSFDPRRFLLSSSKREFITTKKKQNNQNIIITKKYQLLQINCVCVIENGTALFDKMFFFLSNLHEVDHLTICICAYRKTAIDANHARCDWFRSDY